MHKRVKETFSPISKLRLPFLFKTLKGEGWDGRREEGKKGKRSGKKDGMEGGKERRKVKGGLETGMNDGRRN